MHTNETTRQRSVICMKGHVWFAGVISNSAHRSTLSGKSRANLWATIPPKLSPTMLAPPLIPACKSDRKPRRGQQCKYDGASNGLPLQAQVHSSPYPLAVVITVATAGLFPKPGVPCAPPSPDNQEPSREHPFVRIEVHTLPQQRAFRTSSFLLRFAGSGRLPSTVVQRPSTALQQQCRNKAPINCHMMPVNCHTAKPTVTLRITSANCNTTTTNRRATSITLSQCTTPISCHVTYNVQHGTR